ncbi:extracellular solute-binding protein [Embleya sp. NPDC059213]|uniref:ABC transporter substrate-binding protein n=2 Tax=Embleya TaxID=2699295 RepID=UPI0036BD267B
MRPGTPQPDFDARMAAGQATFAGSGWASAFTKYREMQDRGCFNADPVGTSLTAASGQFLAGKSVGFVMTTSAANSVAKAAPGTKIASFPLPASDVVAENRVPVAPSSGLAVNARSGHKAAAIKFLDFLARPEVMSAYARTADVPPLLTGVEYVPSPVQAVVVQAPAQGNTSPWPDQHWPNTQVQQAHFAGVQELLTGRASVNSVLANMDKEYRRK